MRAFKFPIGQLVATPAAIQLIENGGEDLLRLIARHGSGDWGDVCPSDAAENERAVQQGRRILSVYLIEGEAKVWVVTEADRSVTTIFLPEEY